MHTDILVYYSNINRKHCKKKSRVHFPAHLSVVPCGLLVAVPSATQQASHADQAVVVAVVLELGLGHRHLPFHRYAAPSASATFTSKACCQRWPHTMNLNEEKEPRTTGERNRSYRCKQVSDYLSLDYYFSTSISKYTITRILLPLTSLNILLLEEYYH